MKVFIVTGEHPSNPGVPMTVHATRTSANRAAADLVNVITADIERDYDEGTFTNATAGNWEAALSAAQGAWAKLWLEEPRWGVWVTEIAEVQDMAGGLVEYMREQGENDLADKVERMVSPTMAEAVKHALNVAEAALSGAIDNHIYDEANGERPEPDCQFTAALTEVRAVLVGKPEPSLKVWLLVGVNADDSTPKLPFASRDEDAVRAEFERRMGEGWDEYFEEPFPGAVAAQEHLRKLHGREQGAYEIHAVTV